jgi:uncharacterized membrane protein
MWQQPNANWFVMLSASEASRLGRWRFFTPLRSVQNDKTVGFLVAYGRWVMSIGPIQFVVVGFEGDVLESDVLQELLVAGAGGEIRLLDFLILEKDQEGQLWAIDVVDDSSEGEIGFGALAYGLIEQGAVEAEGVEAGESVRALAISEADFGLLPGEVNELVHEIPMGSSAIIALVEHTWARKLHDATLAAGGVMRAQGMLDPAGLALLGVELEAAVAVAEAIEAEVLAQAEGEAADE